MQEKYILAVDDDEIMFRIIRQSLAPLSVPIKQAKDGIEALEYILTGQVRVVILDNCMPGPSGLETVRIFRQTKTGKSLPCIMLTGQDQTELRKEAEELNVDSYLTKPFSPIKLLAAVKQLL